MLMQASQQMRTAKLAAHSFVKLRRCKVKSCLAHYDVALDVLEDREGGG